nr:immunoglobulin light chain junction region [Macaca mulatta]
CSSYTDTNVLF